MRPSPVVSNSSPLIALSQIGHLDLLDRAARKLADKLGLRIIGTLGILLAAKRRGFVTVIRPLLDELLAKGFRISPDLRNQVVADAGEGS